MNIDIAEYPQLSLIAWHLSKDATINGKEALALYERNWRFVEETALERQEQELINLLKDRYGGGFLHV